MVGRAHFPGDEEMPALRRSSTRGPNRDLPSSLSHHDPYQNSRAQHLFLHNSRNFERRSSDNNSISAQPRSRIPVACGRCRKRKIKCSGDNGGPCTNCKQAQHDQCRFLRVSSTEAQMKPEAATYDYNQSGGAASRINCRLPFSYGPHACVQDTPLGLGNYQFRGDSLSAYQFAPKPYYGIPAFGGFTENDDYGLQGSMFPVFSAENLALASNYTTFGTTRAWSATPQLPRNSLFIDSPETPYNHGQISYLRANINTESKNMSFGGNNSTLSGPLPAPLPIVPVAVDRLLPIPASNRPVQVIPYPRPSENGIPVTQNVYPLYPGDFVRTSLKAQNTNSVSDNGSLTSSYVPMPSSSPESISSSQIADNSQALSMGQQQEQAYTPPSSDGLYQNDSSDLLYGHSNRGSQSSQASNDTSLSPSTMVNGRPYVPYQSNSYPQPPMNNISAPSVVHQTSISVK